MARNTIFRRVMFKCAGCGTEKEAKAQVPVQHARTPLATPEGWGTADVMGQHDTFGAVTVLAIPVCSEECGVAFMEALNADPKAPVVGAQADMVEWVRNAQTAFGTGAKSGGLDVEAQKAAEPKLIAVPGDDGFDAPRGPGSAA